MPRESSVARAPAAHSTSSWSSRAAGVPPSPGDNIHFSKHGRNLDSAFTRRETLLLVQPIDLLGDENESERGTGSPAPGKVSLSPRAYRSPTRAPTGSRSPLGPSSPFSSPALATPLRRLRVQENARSSASPTSVRASPEQALDERAQLEQLDGAHDELEAGPIFSEGGDCTESEHEASEGTSDHEDELLKAEVDVLELKLDELDCEPIGAPESDGEDGSDEDNVEPVYAVHQLSHAAQAPAAAPPSPAHSKSELVASETAGVSSECAPEPEAGDELDAARSVNPAGPSFALGYPAALEDEISSLDLDGPLLEMMDDDDESERGLPRLGRRCKEHLSDISSLDLDLEMRYDEPPTEEESDIERSELDRDLKASSAPDAPVEVEPEVELPEVQAQFLPPPAIDPPAQASFVSVVPDSEGDRSLPSSPSPPPDTDLPSPTSTTPTADPSPPLDPAPTPVSVATTPSVEDAKRAARLAFAASAPTVKRQLSKQTALDPPRSRAPAGPVPSPLKMPVARPTTVSRLAPRTQSRIAVSAAPKAGPSTVSKLSLSALPRGSRLMQPTATSAARNVVPSSTATRLKLAKRPIRPAVPQLSASVPPPTSGPAADALVLPSRPASAASSSSASSLSASGLPKPSTRPGLKPPTSIQSKIGGVRRPLGAPVAAPRVAAAAPPPMPLSTHLIIASALVVPPPSASTSTQVPRAAEAVKAASRLGQTISAPTLLQPSLTAAASPRPLPRPARLASPAKVRPQPVPSPARLPRPPPLEARSAPVPRDSPARLPRPPPLSSLAIEARSPERSRKPLRVGDARAGSENAPPRTATAVPARTNSNPTLPSGSFPGRSPAKARIVAPAPLTSIIPTGSLFAAPTASVLTAPAERVDAEIVLEVFRPLAAPAPLPRPKPLAAALEPEPAPLDEPLSGRTPRRAAAATPATPLPRPTRKTLAAAAALREAELLALQPVVAANPEAAAPTRDVPVFTPAPVLTQEQWAQLTQRNTRKNKQHFNKLSVDELVLDENRPPSPTSKIRKSVSGTSTESRKEGREDRAKKRRSALRSSLDGSVVGEDDVVVPASPIEGPLAHFRAAGDDEEYSSPVRGGVLKGKKKSSLAGPESRRVKWDKALVYEGPVTPHGESAGILKRIPLDKYGNSIATSVGFAKPTAVTIVKRIYLDDE